MLGELVPYAGMATGIIITWIVLKIVTAASAADKEQATASDQLVADVARLRADVDALMTMGDRLHELEERQDFTERVLAQARERRLEEGA